MKTKTCARCGRTKNISEYHKNAYNPSGVQHNCKECTNAYMRRRRAAEDFSPSPLPRVKQLDEVFEWARLLVEAGQDIPQALSTAQAMVAKGVKVSR